MEPRHRLDDLRRRLAALRRAGDEFVGDADVERDDTPPESRSADEDSAQ